MSLRLDRLPCTLDKHDFKQGNSLGYGGYEEGSQTCRACGQSEQTGGSKSHMPPYWNTYRKVVREGNYPGADPVGTEWRNGKKITLKELAKEQEKSDKRMDAYNRVRELKKEREEIETAFNLFDRKQKSRVWFGAEAELLEDIIKAKDAAEKILGYINVEIAVAEANYEKVKNGE